MITLEPLTEAHMERSAHPMRSIKLRRLSLSEVFVHLVTQDEGAAAAEKAREELTHV